MSIEYSGHPLPYRHLRFLFLAESNFRKANSKRLLADIIFQIEIHNKFLDHLKLKHSPCKW